MKNLMIPQFDQKLNRIGYTTIKIKNKPDHSDYTKITNMLPGFAVGYCPDVYKLGISVNEIELHRFYDSRQRGTGKLKNHYISISVPV